MNFCMTSLPSELSSLVVARALPCIDLHHIAVIEAFVVAGANEDPYT
jgi:hypothetical protein